MELLLPQMGLGFLILLVLLIMVLPLIAIISILTSDFKDTTTKLIWVVVILFIPILGSILYFLIGRSQRINMSKF